MFGLGERGEAGRGGRGCRGPSGATDACLPENALDVGAEGYRFVGPTSVYAFMQNIGVVNDHVHGCFRASDYSPAR